ncbi:MAG: insulinase family protein, partial [Chloroflexi bacterium]|nr:insulinase family protein [Chloroflexota bacterium]
MLEIAANPIDQAESTTLENGLRVVSATMPNTQAVSYAVLINAGSRFESSAQAGISHFIEHLVFKGTRRWPTPRALSWRLFTSDAADELRGVGLGGGGIV